VGVVRGCGMDAGRSQAGKIGWRAQGSADGQAHRQAGRQHTGKMFLARAI